MTTPTPPALRITGLTLAYPGDSGFSTPALDQISLEVPAGAITGLLGLPGAGKTSLLRAAAGRIAPQAGQVWLPDHIPSIKSWLQGDPDARLDASAGAHDELPGLLAALQIEPEVLAKPASFPSTLQDRARLVPYLLDEAPLLLLDEHPGLTPATAALLQTCLPDHAHERGQAVLLATQHPQVVLSLCDRVAVLRDGKLQYAGPLPGSAGPLENAVYHIRLGGRIDPRNPSWPPGLAVSTEGGDVLLAGELPDQSALYGVLARARDLGLTLLSVERSLPDPVEILKGWMGRG